MNANMAQTQSAIIQAAKLLLHSEDVEADLAAQVIEQLASVAGMEWEIEENDGEPAALNNDERLWVVSTHRLLLGGECIAEWTRCASGSWGACGQAANAWVEEEDTNGGDTVPERVQVLLDLIELEDDIPAVPEPASADETIQPDPDGEYCVFWHTVFDESGNEDRYATQEDAEAVAAERDREFAAAHPGQKIRGYGVRQLVNGEWVTIED